jgi:hypothetical protein
LRPLRLAIEQQLVSVRYSCLESKRHGRKIPACPPLSASGPGQFSCMDGAIRAKFVGCAGRPHRYPHHCWLRERDLKRLAQNPLLDQVNRRSDFVLRYEGCGEKCILRPLSRAAEAARQILPDETSGNISGLLVTFAADGTASRFMVAEGEKLEKTLLEFDFRRSP